MKIVKINTTVKTESNTVCRRVTLPENVTLYLDNSSNFSIIVPKGAEVEYTRTKTRSGIVHTLAYYIIECGKVCRYSATKVSNARYLCL